MNPIQQNSGYSNAQYVAETSSQRIVDENQSTASDNPLSIGQGFVSLNPQLEEEEAFSLSSSRSVTPYQLSAGPQFIEADNLASSREAVPPVTYDPDGIVFSIPNGLSLAESEYQMRILTDADGLSDASGSSYFEEAQEEDVSVIAEMNNAITDLGKGIHHPNPSVRNQLFQRVHENGSMALEIMRALDRHHVKEHNKTRERLERTTQRQEKYKAENGVYKALVKKLEEVTIIHESTVREFHRICDENRRNRQELGDYESMFLESEGQYNALCSELQSEKQTNDSLSKRLETRTRCHQIFARIVARAQDRKVTKISDSNRVLRQSMRSVIQEVLEARNVISSLKSERAAQELELLQKQNQIEASRAINEMTAQQLTESRTEVGALTASNVAKDQQLMLKDIEIGASRAIAIAQQNLLSSKEVRITALDTIVREQSDSLARTTASFNTVRTENQRNIAVIREREALIEQHHSALQTRNAELSNFTEMSWITKVRLAFPIIGLKPETIKNWRK